MNMPVPGFWCPYEYLSVGVHKPREGISVFEDVYLQFLYVQFSKMVMPVSTPTRNVLAFSLLHMLVNT